MVALPTRAAGLIHTGQIWKAIVFRRAKFGSRLFFGEPFRVCPESHVPPSRAPLPPPTPAGLCHSRRDVMETPASYPEPDPVADAWTYCEPDPVANPGSHPVADTWT